MRSVAMGHRRHCEKQVPAGTAFIFLERHPKANGFLFMESSTQYRKFAEECRRFAQSAKTDEQRKILLQMEAVWAKLAEEAKGRAAQARN
jgi:hypothetical protein